MGAVTVCIHEFEPGLCDVCERPSTGGRASSGASMAGKTFELVHVPAVRDDTYLHLNREGESWALRWYPSPSDAAVELGRSSRGDFDPAFSGVRDSISYPYSTSPGGVTVKDSRYWFREVAQANRKLTEVDH